MGGTGKMKDGLLGRNKKGANISQLKDLEGQRRHANRPAVELDKPCKDIPPATEVVVADGKMDMATTQSRDAHLFYHLMKNRAA